MNRIKLAFHKLTHWEYWPYQIVYLPIYFQYLYYVLRTRSFFYFNASNPSIRNGGFLMESKKEIYDLIPLQYYPKTILVGPNENLEAIIQRINSENIQFPLKLSSKFHVVYENFFTTLPININDSKLEPPID